MTGTHRNRRFVHDDAGQALVELALVLPLMLLIMVGIIEFARAWNLQQVMTDAVREGGRRAALADNQPWDSTAKAMWLRLDQAGYNPTYSSLPGSAPTNFKVSNQLVTITLTMPYRFWVLPFRQITMKSSFTVRNE